MTSNQGRLEPQEGTSSWVLLDLIYQIALPARRRSPRRSCGFSQNNSPWASPRKARLCGALLIFSLLHSHVVGAEKNEVDISKLPPPASRPVDFVREIRPIFEANCYKCHGTEKQKSEFRLDVKSVALKGGEHGQDIFPGKSAESPLIHFVAGMVDDMQMPPKGDKLTAEQIGLLRAWIDQGALWPDGIDAAKVKAKNDYWIFKPAGRPEVPQLNQEHWARNEIDDFILQRLEKENLKPSPEAGKQTLIRRLSFDLTGLPPAPEEVKRFLADASERAYEKLVDQLLDSPRYGERWARHWLDVIHYGETHGYDKDKTRPNAWPYRDYVIRAFNQDMPYSRFIEEQLAGDVLFPDEPDGVVATGFIAAGPWDFVGHVELPETKTDGLIARYNDRDDMVMTAMATFQSLTVHCARCHDHKFDPITQEDYYSLQAVFAGVDRADRSFDSSKETFQQRKLLTKEKSTLETRQRALNEVAAKTSPAVLRLIDARRDEMNKQLASLPKPVIGKQSKSLGYHSQIMASSDATKWVQVDLGKSLPIDQIVLIPSHLAYGGHSGPGFGFPSRFRVDISDDPQFVRYQTVADQTGSDFPNPGDEPYFVNTSGKEARYVRVTAAKLWKRTDDWIFALDELVVLSGKKDVAAGMEVSALDSIEAEPVWAKKNLVDGKSILAISNSEESPSNGYHSEIESTPSARKWVQVDLGKSVSLDEIRLIPARPTDFPDTPGFGFPLRFQVEIADDANFEKPKTLMDQTTADYANPGDHPVVVAAMGHLARFVRVTTTRLWERTKDYVFALGELQVYSGGGNLALGAKVTAFDSIESGRWSAKYLVDGFSSRNRLADFIDGLNELSGLSKRPALQAEIDQLNQERKRFIDSLLDEETKSELAKIDYRLLEVNQKLAALQPPKKVYAAANDFAPTGSFKPATEPRAVHLLTRGEVKQPGRLVAPGTLSCLPGLESKFSLTDPKEEGSRRAALAKWITDRRNLLTRRSIVNRIWQYHFGRGIVDTPNDFGHMGSLPTHPELLDWLAFWFLEKGESIKQLHRLILTSSTYRQSSMDNAEFAKIDGDNRYLWRMNRARLDAESLHDSILSISGKLDLTMGGPSVQQFFFKDDHSPVYDYGRFNIDSPEAFRRSIYRFIVRSVADPFMETLDCPDPSLLTPKRNTTVTALQALTLLNNPFVIHQSEYFSERLTKTQKDLTGQIDGAYQLALSRPPKTEETVNLIQYAHKHGMASVCRLLFNSSEFMFVD